MSGLALLLLCPTPELCCQCSELYGVSHLLQQERSMSAKNEVLESVGNKKLSLQLPVVPSGVGRGEGSRCELSGLKCLSKLIVLE